jgi:predicted CopG family antitoxin
MNQSDARHTITLDDSTYQKLRSKGNFGETYADVILRLIRNTDDTWRDSLKKKSNDE